MNKVLTSPSSMGQIDSRPFDLLRENGYEVINNPYGRKLTEDEVIALAADCVGIVAGVEPLTKRVMDALPGLRCISRVGVGMDSVDMEYASKKGIIVTSTPDGPSRGVAELALGLTLSLLRKIPQADAALKNRKWKKQIGCTFLGRTVGIIGLGRIGRMVAEMFLGLGNTVIGCDVAPNLEWTEEKGVKLLPFDEVLAQADIISLHIPSAKDKKPAITARELSLMKPGAFLINTARGDIVDEGALFDALKSGKLAGAATDVFSSEPYTGPLCDLDNIILTPHLGSYAAEVKLKMEVDAVENLINALK